MFGYNDRVTFNKVDIIGSLLLLGPSGLLLLESIRIGIGCLIEM